MKRTLVEVYALAVCFVTVGCFVIALGIGLYGLVGVASPGFTMSGAAYSAHQTNDGFFASRAPLPFSPTERAEPQRRPPEEQLTRERLESFDRAIRMERRDSAQSAVKAGIVVLIDLLVFYVHWSIARRTPAAAAS